VDFSVAKTNIKLYFLTVGLQLSISVEKGANVGKSKLLQIIFLNITHYIKGRGQMVDTPA
jgi:hypothetical protein